MLHDLVFQSPAAGSDAVALSFRGESKSYAAFERDIRALAFGFASLGLEPRSRVAIFLDKSFDVATSIFAASAAGLVFVPVNPVLRPAQVRHILADCNARVLITSRSRYGALEAELVACPDLAFVFLVDDDTLARLSTGITVTPFSSLSALGDGGLLQSADVDGEMAAILYTSGSTGNPKGVVFSHRNLVAGARSVAEYLKYRAGDRIVNIPPYSFDFGLNQLFSAMSAGVTAVLHNFATVEDLMATIVAERVTGVSGVPTVMIQLAAQNWPPEAVQQIRYLSTTGGRMPESAVRSLRKSLPDSDLYLMYGLTEAFRSTYLPPEEVDRRPGSIGKAVPSAEVLVVRPDGSLCDPDEPGELVHKGVLVTLGYWNDPARTAERFRPAPGEPADKSDPEIAVWSGDTVKRDADGFIYYIGRRDEMIKTSGYRVSPTEVEEGVFASGKVAVAAAIGVEDEVLGQTIVVFAVPKPGVPFDPAAILDHCRRILPAYMVPRRIVERCELPLNPNGKIDRKALAHAYSDAPPPRDSAAALALPQTFLERWRDSALELVGMRRRSFASVRDVFCFTFPDRAIAPSDSFHSIGGDSLSYVSLYTGLNEHLGRVPDDWADRTVADLERLGRSRDAATAVAPDILLRVVAMIAVVVQHSNFLAQIVPNGAAALMMMISGLSFARFSWNRDPAQTRRAAVRFFTTIYVPLFIYLAVVFAAVGQVNWAELLLIENWTRADAPLWWSTGWYIENLCQFVALMAVFAAVPGVAAYSFRRPFAFAALLVACGLVAFALFSMLPPGFVRGLHFASPGFFWLFALGWLIGVADTAKAKFGALAMIAGSVLLFLSIATVWPTPLAQFMFADLASMTNRVFWFWMLAGGAFLMFGRSIIVPRAVNVLIVLIARAMLFVYLFYLQISLAIPVKHFSVQLVLGALTSIALWLVWESFWRAWRTNDEAAGPSGSRRLVEAQSG